jgi:hypothetical protein
MELQWGIGYPLGEDSLLQECASEAIFSLRLEAQAFPDAAPKKRNSWLSLWGKGSVGSRRARWGRNYQEKA